MKSDRLPVLLLSGVLAIGSALAAGLSPADWPAEERAELERLESRTSPEAYRVVEGGEWLVAGTMSPTSVRAGVEVLRQGGNAADAAAAVALTQVARSLGSFVSYAGIAQVLYFDSKQGTVHSLDAGWATYLGETEPLTIPTQPLAPEQGRRTLVPGFMAGMESLQQRFGVLAFGDLFEPAIWYAEHGVTISPSLSAYFKFREKELSRTESGRQFLRQGGRRFPAVGDRFVQTDLARTLKAVARQGAQYMYTGEWGQKYVDTIRREGGRGTIEDMRRYQPIWQEPLTTSFAGCSVWGPGRSGEGGYQLLASLNLIEEMKIDRLAPYWQSPDSFVSLSRVMNITDLPVDWMLARARTKGVALEARDRATKAFAAALAPLVNDFFRPPQKPEPAHHSAGIVVIDRAGNVAAIVHSINTVNWGSTGLVVDGVPISDPAAPDLAAIQPGNRKPDIMCPLIATRDGKPVLAVAGTGAVVRETTRIALGVLGYKADAKMLMTAPPLITQNGARKFEFLLPEGGYSAEFVGQLRSRGLTFEIAPRNVGTRDPRVFCIIGPETGRRSSVELSGIGAFSAAQ